MADLECVLQPMLKKIAEEEKYYGYTTELSLVQSGGANYTSQLYKITLSAPGKDDIKLFAKVAALGEKFRATTALKVYETENMFYNTLLPKYREYEAKYKFPAEDRLVLPKFYGASAEYMKEVIVLEDLTAKGYRPFDRFSCFDWEYASKSVSFLAKLHALSVRYKIDFPEKFENMCQKLAVKVSLDHMKDFIDKSNATALEVVVDKYKERLARFLKDNANDEKFQIYFDAPRKVVLNHGDFRPSNIMHRTNNDGPLELLIIDHQLLKEGNPVTDLLYYLICGSDEEFRADHLTRYFDRYYEEFSRILRKLKINPFEVYTRNQFDEDVQEILPFGIILGMFTLPFITIEEEDAPKVEDGFDFDSITIKASNTLPKRLNGLVKDYVKMGIL